MHNSMMNYSPCDTPQSQGTKYLSNDEGQKAHKAPSPHHDSLIRDANALNVMSGKNEPVEPSRLLESMVGIKSTTPAAYKAIGKHTSLQEWEIKPQPLSNYHSFAPDDSPRLLGHHSNDIDNPYVMSETSQVADNDSLHLNPQSRIVLKHHRDNSIDALRVSGVFYRLYTPCMYCTRDIPCLEPCYAQAIITMQGSTESILALSQAQAT
jgi:hypothetical protein